MSGFMDSRMEEFHAPHMDNAWNRLQQQQGNTPQMDVPNMELTQQGMGSMQDLIGRQGANLERQFFGQMMGGPGSPQHQVAQNAQAMGDRDRQQLIQQAMSSGVPMQSSAFGRGLSSAALDQDLQRNMQMSMLDMEQRNMGAQGLAQQMPQFLAQPAGMEEMFIRGRQPFQMANHQAQMQQQDAINQYLNQLAFYQPDRMERPSYFQMMMDPIATIAGGAAGGWAQGLMQR